MIRPGPARWLRRVLAGLAVAMAALALAGAAYQSIATARDRRAYPPPRPTGRRGRLRLHIYCIGRGSPSVILDALFPGTVSNWAWVQPQLAGTTRVCAYDRAGLGRSDSGPAPRDAMQHARELHALLTKAAIPEPYVLVGHSLGGLSVRMFADQYPGEVASACPVGAPAELLPRPDLPPRQRLELQAFFNSVKSLRTIRDVDASFSAALDQVRGIGGKPLVVVLGSRGDGSIPALQDLLARQAALSANSSTVMVAGATDAGLVDNRTRALQTSAAILGVIRRHARTPTVSGRI